MTNIATLSGIILLREMNFNHQIYKTHSKAISCTKYFCISGDHHPESAQSVLFQAPSDEIVSLKIDVINSSVHFIIQKKELDDLSNTNLELHHIVEYIHQLSSRNFSYEGCRLYIHITGNTAMFIVKRIQDYLFTRIYYFETVEDLLYHVQFCFQSLKLDRSSDQLILCGNIESDSKIAKLLSVYYSNVIIDNSIPLSSFDD